MERDTTVSEVSVAASQERINEPMLVDSVEVKRFANNVFNKDYLHISSIVLS